MSLLSSDFRMIFSMPVVQRLVDECRCMSDDSPDDMVIGMCLKRLEIPITHVPYIHQVVQNIEMLF